MAGTHANPGSPAWPAGLVRVWRYTLDAPGDVVESLRGLLSAEEHDRARRFRGAALQTRFITGRGTLRRILGQVLEIDPAEVEFTYGLRGKPGLAGGVGLEFNLAHSGGSALCAVGMRQALGVDLESIRPMENAERIIGRYFTPGEQEQFLAHAGPERLAAFYRGWTRKEAFLKATGEGLAASLDSFEVSLAAAGTAHGRLLLRVGEDAEEAGRWTLLDLDLGAEHAAALVARGQVGRVEHAEWRVDRPF